MKQKNEFYNKFYNAIETNNIKEIKLLMKDENFDPSMNNNFGIQFSSYKGYFKIVKLLLKDSRIDPSMDDNYAFLSAINNSHLQVFKLLLNHPKVNPANFKNYAIFKIFNLIPELLKVVNPNFQYKKKIYILNELWKDKRVKNTLQKDRPELYDFLIKKEINHKLTTF